jgi:tetratricopeptide (TPR) repeat protein
MLQKIKIISAFGILFCSTLPVVNQYLADRYYPAQASSLGANSEQSEKGADSISSLKKAIEQTPSNAAYYHKLANLELEGSGKLSDSQNPKNALIQKAIENQQRAIELNPTDSRNHMGLARAYSLKEPSTFNENSARSLEKAILLSPSDAALSYKAGCYYLSKWRQLSQNQKMRALDILGRAIKLDEAYFDRIFKDCWRIINNYKLIQKIVPNSSTRRAAFARFLLDREMLTEYVIEMAKVEYLLIKNAEELLAESEHFINDEAQEAVLMQLRRAEGFYHYINNKFPGLLDDSFERGLNERINSVYTRVYISRAKSELRHGNNQAAIGCLKWALKKINPADRDSMQEISDYVLQILRLDDDIEPHVTKANIEFLSGNYASAIGILEALRHKNEQYPMPIYKLGAVFALLDRSYKASGRIGGLHDLVNYYDSLTTKVIKPDEWRGELDDPGADYVYQNGEMYWSGSVFVPVTLRAGRFELVILAKASSADGIWPLMVVRLDGEIVGIAYVTDRNWREFPFILPIPYSYNGELKISFVNDGGNSSLHEDRNLYIGDVTIRPAVRGDV